MSMMEYMCYNCRHLHKDECNGGGGFTYLQRVGRCPGAKGEEGLFGMKLPKFEPKSMDTAYQEVST